jgi:TolB-like protein
MPYQLDGLSTAELAPDVSLQLGRILRSSHFVKSPQAANLLAFLVNQTLSSSPGETPNQLKEYSIAVQVFGRPASFDSSADNIVRVEVRRVRAKLERYYEDEGASDPIGISIPKGTYVPVFRKRHYAEFDSSGRTISHYELGRRRCVNRWQSAYDAKCLHLHRFVTVILPTRLTMEDEGRRQSLLEKMRAGVVDHPGVAAVHDVEATQERVIIAAAALPGRSLREYVEGSRLAGDPAVGFARELANALASGHSLGMLHGNLNPDSLSINEGASGEAPHAHLMPFGMLPLVDIEHASFEGFRPPEWSVGGEPDLRSDVWSFGALVWFACYGVAPPPVPSAAGEGAEGGSMPPQLAGVLARCLQPEPGLRYASAVEIAEEMGPVSAAPVVPREEAPPAKPRWARHKVIVLTAISLVAVVATIIVSAHFRSKPPAGSEPRLIVLPLENTNADPENEPYCRAAADLLAARLARLPGVQVVSSLSVDRRKRDQFSAEFLQTKLHVDYAVEGTLLRLGPEFQATVQLLDVGAGRHVWSDSYGGPWTDVSARIEELADKAAQSMGLVVQREQIQPASSPAINVMAHDAWLKGRFSAIEYWNTLLPGHFDDAERRLRRALELHPSYVNAMVDLGQLYLSGAYAHSLGQRGVEPSKGSQADLYDKAEEFAASAVAVDPESGPAHAVLGSVYTDTGRLRVLPHPQHFPSSPPDRRRVPK